MPQLSVYQGSKVGPVGKPDRLSLQRETIARVTKEAGQVKRNDWPNIDKI